MDAPAAPPTKTLSLALQGGGSHGAFTWGVLDTLLADRRITIEGLSGTSAGAVNAVALASGLAAPPAGTEPRVAARECLARVWDEVGHWGALGALPAQFGRLLWGGGSSAQWLQPGPWAQALGSVLSPYQTNPLNLNPLREVLQRRIAFAALRSASAPRVFVSATHVATGKAAIFSGRQLTLDAVLASTCLPTLFQAVRIDEHSYWDGGYSVNPALSPLIASCSVPDILVVQINPLRREDRPESASAILDRMNELTFNASLMTQMRGIDRINRLLASGALPHADCKVVRLHRIDGGAALAAYAASTKIDADPKLLRELFHMGQEAARRWLGRHFDALGVTGTVDVARDYEDDTRIDWPQAAEPALEAAPVAGAVAKPPSRGLRPWLARVLGRRSRDGT